MAQLARIRRSTSDAVCCASIRMTPGRPAALGEVEQDLLDRAVALARRLLLAAISRGYPDPASPAAPPALSNPVTVDAGSGALTVAPASPPSG
jgi:hypothetical protein